MGERNCKAMTSLRPFFREAGSGPGVVCLHANSSASVQWRGLMETLAGRFHVLAPDAYGSGQSPAWPADRLLSLRDEVDLLEPVFERAGNPHVLVGHSYGAAVALVAAISRPDRVRAMALYEPVLFALLDAESPPPNEADGIRDAVTRAVATFDAGDPAGAAECFIDFWMGRGAWARTPDSRKAPIAATIGNLRQWAHALMTEPTPLAAFSTLRMPVLLMTGSETRAPARGVARLLAGAFPQIEVVELKGVGHMGPITHPEVVNEVLAGFLER
jgi:pimeloyl-ACP methyl ester carboxylesterase